MNTYILFVTPSGTGKRYFSSGLSDNFRSGLIPWKNKKQAIEKIVEFLKIYPTTIKKRESDHLKRNSIQKYLLQPAQNFPKEI